MRLAVIGLTLFVSCASFVVGAEQPAVKKSEQGICHERGSATYQRTKHYESFDSLDACLATGGQLAKNVATGDADADSRDGGA
jgi:hypothetical protein